MVKVEKIIPGGMGLGTLEDGKKIFFWNALPGENVTDFLVTKQKSHYNEAIATAIESESPFRVKSKDTCFLSTSPWQIIDFNYELQLKQAIVTELFAAQNIKLNNPPIYTDGQDYFYRNKMEYALYWDNNDNLIKLAFHARGSHRKIPIDKSSIERPEIFETAKRLVDELNQKHEEARKYQSLLLRCNQKGEVSGGFYENHQPHPTFTNLKDTILGQEYSYSPNGFFQINLPVYEMVLNEIKEHITTDNVLDLYAGVGTIGLSVARDHQLTLVECDPFAFAEMAKNITLSDSRPAGPSPRAAGATPRAAALRSVRNGNTFAILDKSENVTNYLSPTQTVILDPPRAGCDRKLVDRLNEVKPTKIIYLSCNPATQARDVALLQESYDIETAKIFNFFPHTPHIENLIVLSLKYE